MVSISLKVINLSMAAHPQAGRALMTVVIFWQLQAATVVLSLFHCGHFVFSPSNSISLRDAPRENVIEVTDDIFKPVILQLVSH